MPYFTIILPIYNRAHFAGAAISSVVAQTLRDWQLIVVDDGSADNTKAIVEGFKHPGITYVWQTNQDFSAARNKGLDLATGDYICFLDSDDTWRDNHLQVLQTAIEQNRQMPALYFTSMCWHFTDRKQDVVFESPGTRSPVEYIIANQPGTPTVCIPRSVIQNMRFNITLKVNEDVELYARIAAHYPLVQIREITVDVRVHDSNSKALLADYINLRLKAMKLIFSNHELRNKCSPQFRKEIFRNLRHQLIIQYQEQGDYSKMKKAIIFFLFAYPLDAQNKSRLLLLLQHVPGGKHIISLGKALRNK